MKTIIINFISKEESDQLLDYCLEVGCDEFTFIYLYSNEIEAKKADNFLKKFSIFKNQNKYVFNQKSLDQLKKTCEKGILPKGKNLELGLEDIILYKNTEKFLEIVSHENMGFLNLNKSENDLFKKLNIPFKEKK